MVSSVSQKVEEEQRSQRDFRSDTVTVPTAEMLSTVFQASTGDNVFEEDETTIVLEKRMASLMGKQAGLFVVSGTMGNQLCLRTLLKQPPHAILCDYNAHINNWEAGAVAINTQAMMRPVPPSNGQYTTAKDFAQYVVPRGDIHHCPTEILCIENTISGNIVPFGEIQAIQNLAHEHGMTMHLDGARIFEASAATGIPLQEYGKLVDSASICLSKGLGAPMGSVIVGTHEFIKRAKWFRKAMGGGVRQNGIVSAPAIWCLDNVLPQLSRIHHKAQSYGKFVQQLGFKLARPIETNMVVLNLESKNVSAEKFAACGAKYGLKLRLPRIVFHWQISDEAIESLTQATKDVLS